VHPARLETVEQRLMAALAPTPLDAGAPAKA
jgi:hypothetical protein